MLKIERLNNLFKLPIFDSAILDIKSIFTDGESRNLYLLTYRRGLLMLSYPEFNES